MGVMAARRLSFGLACCALWIAGQAEAQSAAPEELFSRGVAAADAGRWVEAERAFAAVCEVEPTPSALLNLATARYRQVKPVSALEALDRLDALADAPETDRRMAARMREQCEGLLAVLSIHVEPAADWLKVDLAEVAIEGANVEVRVDPGLHLVQAGAEGYASAESRVSLAEAEHSVLALSLERLPEREPTVALAPAPAGEVDTDDALDPGDRRRRRRRRALISVAALLVAGSAAAGTAIALGGGSQVASCSEADHFYGSCQ